MSPFSKCFSLFVVKNTQYINLTSMNVIYNYHDMPLSDYSYRLRLSCNPIFNVESEHMRLYARHQAATLRFYFCKL